MNAGNGGGDYDEREYVDAGFLEFVRLGIKRPDDPLIIKSLAVVDKVIKVETPNGPSWYRYNHDGYGEMADGQQLGAGRQTVGTASASVACGSCSPASADSMNLRAATWRQHAAGSTTCSRLPTRA